MEYQDKKWTYSTQRDRSFYTEILKGLRPDGKTLLVNNIDGPRKIPQGTYDLGDGYYDPQKHMVCKYDGQFMRETNPGEEEWILNKCRYNPKIHDDNTHLDGQDDMIIQEMIKLNQNPALLAARQKGNTKKKWAHKKAQKEIPWLLQKTHWKQKGLWER